ncbi:MAG: hypothetical protein DMG30_00470 [Acidobacteria bacterium]|nr:MAG: hypothetical protein DMG30_00470 [Acidobacteriota bacterium]
MSGVRILVADDHVVLRRGVRAILQENLNWKVVAEARDGREAMERADVAIFDFGMPKRNGLGGRTGDPQKPATDQDIDS